MTTSPSWPFRLLSWTSRNLALWIAAAFAAMFVACVVFLGTTIFSPDFSPPTIDELRTSVASQKSRDSSLSNDSSDPTLDREFGSRIFALLNAGEFDESAYSIVMGDLNSLDPAYRDLYMESAERLVRSVPASDEQATLLDAFRADFKARAQRAEQDRLRRYALRAGLVSAAAICIVIVLGFSIVPVLAQIELNTRQRPVA